MYKLISAIPIGETFNSPFGRTGGKTLGDLVTLVVNLSLIISGVFFLFLFVMGGFKIISSAGSGDAKSTASGKQAVTSALIGFTIIFVSYWIIRIIEVITGVNFTTAPAGL